MRGRYRLSWMTLPDRRLFWIASLRTKRGTMPPAHVFAARSAAGRPAKKTSGSAPAVTSGTLSIREPSAQPACTSGLKRSASLAADGRRIRIGILANLKGRSTHGQGQRAVSERSMYQIRHDLLPQSAHPYGSTAARISLEGSDSRARDFRRGTGIACAIHSNWTSSLGLGSNFSGELRSTGTGDHGRHPEVHKLRAAPSDR